jgi:hypothetical protein
MTTKDDGQTAQMTDEELATFRKYLALGHGYLIFSTLDDLRALLARLDAKQAKIDRLMLEYCPDEMTPEQSAAWKAHQTACSEAVGMAIDRALAAQSKGKA